jgi:hypothetical protein
MGANRAYEGADCGTERSRYAVMSAADAVESLRGKESVHFSSRGAAVWSFVEVT